MAYQYVPKPKKAKVCVQCGAEFWTAHKLKKTCSPECSHAHRDKLPRPSGVGKCEVLQARLLELERAERDGRRPSKGAGAGAVLVERDSLNPGWGSL